MDEKTLGQIMSNLDSDLMKGELDAVMGNIDIDIDSISKKAHSKLRKEQKKTMKHRKHIAAIIAASLVVVCGVTTVYVSEISNFLKSLANRTGVYSTVVEGTTYYLESPVALGENQSLIQAMFRENVLNIRLVADTKNRPEVRVKVGGKEMEPGGFMGEEDGMTLAFYDVSPTDKFDLIVAGKSYPITLAGSKSVVDDAEIIQAEPNSIDWVSMGYKKLPEGIQILTTFEDNKIQLRSLVIPEKDKVTQSFAANSGNSQREEFQPLVGYDKDGKAYEYAYDPNDMGRPLTVFTSDAPANQAVKLQVPGIAVEYKKNVKLDIPLPAVGKTESASQTIDLGLQKMTLQSVERTSDTTATVRFKLNTGERSDVRVWSASIDSRQATSGELLWENGTCTMQVTFKESANSLDVTVSSPSFFIDGNWIMNIQ